MDACKGWAVVIGALLAASAASAQDSPRDAAGGWGVRAAVPRLALLDEREVGLLDDQVEDGRASERFFGGLTALVGVAVTIASAFAPVFFPEEATQMWALGVGSTLGAALISVGAYFLFDPQPSYVERRLALRRLDGEGRTGHP